MLSREAANWLARLQSGREPDIQRKFQRWRDSDPRHAAMFERIHRRYEQAALLRHSTVLKRREHEPAGNRQWRARPALAAAAAMVLIVLAGAFLLVHRRTPFAGTEAVMLTTGVGEIRQVDLADGSRVTLDTDTKVDVQIGHSDRHARVQYGRARFHIAEASEPFVVQVDGLTVRTRQGVIDVEQHARQDRLEVLAGAADVRPSDGRAGPNVALGRGKAVTIASGGGERIHVAPPAADWTRGMLQFDRTPLADAVALANRYSACHIILERGLDRFRVTGGFRAGDTLGLSKAIAAAFHLSLRKDKSGDLVLSPTASSADRKNTGGE